MFSYQNKVVAIKAIRSSGSGVIDVLVNSAYVGSITGTGQGANAYFIGSNNSSLNLTGVSGNPTGYVYYFSDLLLKNGINDLISSNNIGSPIISGLEIDLYDISGSALVNPTPIPATNFDTITGSFTWSGASANAVSSGGRLAVLNTFRKSNIPARSLDLWIGATDTGVEGTWRWLDGSLLSGSGTYQNWDDGEPNNDPPDENYAYSYGTSYGSYRVNKWNDALNEGNDFPYYVGGYLLEKTGNLCYIFDLQYPTPNPPIVCPEFDPRFDVDTGNLNQIFTGSGIHLQKDVTFFFDILDQQLNPISSNQQFLDNPLIDGCVFDVLNIDGTTAAENFFTGKYARSVTVTALDNENIFGAYQKDFGVRCKLPNTFDGSIFTGVFLAYGNVPNILDIVPNYTEFSGAAQATESFSTAIVLQNDLKFTQMDRYDVYALTGSGSAVNELTFLDPSAQEGYLFTQSAVNISDTYNLTINKGELQQDTPYYFTVVPYGALGPGSPFVFGPATFVSTQTNITYPAADISAENIYFGTGFSSTIYKTGRFSSSTGILHEFSSGQFSSVKYFIEVCVSGSGQRRLSELKGVVNTTGFDLTKESVNDTLTTYRLTGVSGGLCGLHASGIGYSGFSYKLQATMI